MREEGGCEVAGIDSAGVDLVRSLVGGDGDEVGGLVGRRREEGVDSNSKGRVDIGLEDVADRNQSI